MLAAAGDLSWQWAVTLAVLPLIAALATTILNRRAEDKRRERDYARQDAQRIRDEEREIDARHAGERRSAYVGLMIAAHEAQRELDEIMHALAIDRPVGNEYDRLDSIWRDVGRAHELVDMLGSTKVRLAAIRVRIAHHDLGEQVRRFGQACQAGTYPRPAPTGESDARAALDEFNKQARFELGLDKPIPGVDT